MPPPDVSAPSARHPPAWRVPPSRAVGLLLLLALLVGAGLILLRTPILALADNSDFWRVGDPLGIEVPTATSQAHVRRRYGLTDEDLSPILVSVSVLVAPVLFIQKALGNSSFDLYPVGLMYGALLLGVVGLALRGGIPLALLVLVVWRSVDTPMLLHYHTLYVETPVWLGLLVLCGLLYTSPEVTRWSLARTASATALLLFIGFSKHAYAIIPLCVVLAAAFVHERRSASPPRQAAPRLAALGLAALLPFSWALWPPESFREAASLFNAINGVTKGLLLVSSDPATAVQRLGLPAAVLQLRDRTAFDAELQQPGMEEAVLALQSSSKLALAIEYARDPLAIGRVLAEVTRQLPDATRVHFGNFEPGDGPPYGQFHVAWEWSAWAGRLLSASGAVFWLVLGVAAALLLASRRERWWARFRPRLAGARAVAAFLFAFVLLEIPVTVIGDGFFDFVRHVHQLRACFDVLAILLAHAGVTELLRVLSPGAEGRADPARG